MPAESGASCAFAASIKRAAALREGPLPFAVPVAVNLRRMSLLIQNQSCGSRKVPMKRSAGYPRDCLRREREDVARSHRSLKFSRCYEFILNVCDEREKGP